LKRREPIAADLDDLAQRGLPTDIKSRVALECIVGSGA
jgi:hypothetical protein